MRAQHGLQTHVLSYVHPMALTLPSRGSHSCHSMALTPAAAGSEESIEAVGFALQHPLAASAGVDGFLRIWDYNVR